MSKLETEGRKKVKRERKGSASLVRGETRPKGKDKVKEAVEKESVEEKAV